MAGNTRYSRVRKEQPWLPIPFWQRCLCLQLPSRAMPRGSRPLGLSSKWRPDSQCCSSAVTPSRWLEEPRWRPVAPKASSSWQQSQKTSSKRWSVALSAHFLMKSASLLSQILSVQSEAQPQRCAMTSLLPSMLPMHAHSSHCTVGSSQQPVRASEYICKSGPLKGWSLECPQKHLHILQLSHTECTRPEWRSHDHA